MRPRRWVCPSCLLRTTPPSLGQQRRSFLFTSRAAPAAVAAANPVDHTPSGAKQDDELLRQIFDSPAVWKDFAKGAGTRSSGLFNNAYLTKPEGFIEYAETSMRKALAIADKVLKAHTLEDYRSISRDLDRLSDILCRVLDMTDFVRLTHPDLRTRRAADEAWTGAYQVMNELNTTPGLNDQLGKAIDNPEVSSTWTEEEMVVAKGLKLDFEKSPVNQPKQIRDRFVQLTSEISRVGAIFSHQEMPAEQQYVALPSSRLRGMDPVLARKLTMRGAVYLFTGTSEARLALRTVQDEDARKQIFYASRTASKKSIEQLEYLTRLRAELASLTGFDSYGQYVLRDRMMAKNPEAVNKFLQGWAASNGSYVKQEMEDLLAAKMKQHPGGGPLQPWDKDFYSEVVRGSMKASRRRDDFLPAYFSLGRVFQGLSRLFTRLYGLRLVPRAPLHGETWHPDVRRLDVVSDTEGHVGVLYCDLFHRENKSPNPAHFTLRCSREISQAEIAEAAQEAHATGRSREFSSAEQAANDGMSISIQPNGVVKQLPTIALICDFESRHLTNRPALLSLTQVETLFHEMGHAVHSFLARTGFQNVAGTRCATDLAELPSTLMEYFATDPETLALFAGHYETGAPLPYDLVAEEVRYSKRFEASDMENQIIMSMLDQDLHSAKAMQPGFDSTELYLGLQRKFGNSPPDPAGTRWHGFFGHLHTYGATYYSYAFDRVLAHRTWKVAFDGGQNGGALNRENGERLKNSLLKWGGGRDPWKCLADALRDERLADGGEEAMALVGTWGSKRQI